MCLRPSVRKKAVPCQPLLTTCHIAVRFLFELQKTRKTTSHDVARFIYTVVLKELGCLIETCSKVLYWNISVIVRRMSFGIGDIEIGDLVMPSPSCRPSIFFTYNADIAFHRRTGDCRATNTLEQPYSIEVALLYSKDMGKNHTQEFS